MTDRSVWLAHMRQIYCFSPFLGVLLLFKVYHLNIVGFPYVTRLGWAFSRFFINEQGMLLQGCIGIKQQRHSVLGCIECLFLIDLVCV